MLSLALFSVTFLFASVAAAALDGLCAQSDSLAACHEQVVRDIYATVANPLAALAGPKPEQWADDVKGRISPLGTYDDYEGTKEYFYGIPAGVRPVAIHFTYLVVTEDSVYSSVEAEVGSLNLSIAATANLTQNIVWFFNEAGQVHYYDGVVVDAGAFAENAVMKGILPQRNPIERICEAEAEYCTDELQQYESVSECQQFLATVPLGSLDRGASNSVACRNLHAGLVALRPDIHCSHIGKAGGGKCTDVAYDDYLPFAVPSTVSSEIESIVAPVSTPSAKPECEKS